MSNIAEFADIPEYSVTGNLTLQDVSNLVTEIYTRNYKAVNGTAPPLNKADPIMLTLKSMTELYYMMIQIAEKRTRCALLKTATGAELDNMGLPFGVKRNGATYATVTVRFSLSAVLKTVAMIPQEPASELPRAFILPRWTMRRSTLERPMWTCWHRPKW